ncbi:hypothetical protein PALB_13060 [Pseudoalteromonas luteoviolacea B = ATCC 29581]|nr:hypothetical protein PALB_13060 [Pseudoalteromonas luteoviolacea B = ATCC 29581]
MNKRIEPELLSIKPDLDQVEDFKKSQAQLKNTTKTTLSDDQNTTKAVAVKSNSTVTWFGAISILALAASAFGLYQQNITTKAQLLASEQRIAQLERTLSATGEEMGNSTVALQAKLTAVSKRQDELWTQMDKLWASAWRRNQTEIGEIKEQAANFATSQNKLHAEAAASIKAVAQDQTELTLKVSLLQEQLQEVDFLKRQLSSTSTELNKLKSQSQSRDSKQVELGASMAQLEISQKALAEQLQRLEKRIGPAG